MPAFNKTEKTVFVPCPSNAQVAKFDECNRRRKFAARPNRRSKLLPYLASISLCVRQQRSAQGIANFLEHFHQVQVNRSTVTRFLAKHPLLVKRGSGTWDRA